MAMPWSRRRRMAEVTRLASWASRGRWARRTPPAAPRRRSARGQSAPACARPGSGLAPDVRGRSPAASLLEKLRRGGLHPSAIQRPQRVRYSWPRNTDSATVKCGIRLSSWWITRMPAASMAAGLPRAAGDRRGSRCRCRPDKRRRGS